MQRLLCTSVLACGLVCATVDSDLQCSDSVDGFCDLEAGLGLFLIQRSAEIAVEDAFDADAVLGEATGSSQKRDIAKRDAVSEDSVVSEGDEVVDSVSEKIKARATHAARAARKIAANQANQKARKNKKGDKPGSYSVELEDESTAIDVRMKAGRRKRARLGKNKHKSHKMADVAASTVNANDTLVDTMVKWAGGAGEDSYDMVLADDTQILRADSAQEPTVPVDTKSDDDEEEGLGGEEYHCRGVWNVITSVKRHKHKRAKDQDHRAGLSVFFESAVVYEWCIFGMALTVFFPLFYILSEWPSSRTFHIIALMIWVALGGIYNCAVWVRLGHSAGVMWFTGYLLEFIFSIENVFVFHIIVKAFRPPKRVTQKALFLVVLCQIVFEMVFFMGLAQRVRAIHVLPYVLGVWLLYVGYHATKDEHDDFNIKESPIVRGASYLLGRRLLDDYDDRGALIKFSNGTLCVTMMFPLLCCLLAVDFMLEVDVTLTKIEELPNEYISFTSSAAAAFAVPELFNVASDLFQRFNLLKYGISFVLIFYGLQMLLHTLFMIPDLTGCGIIVIVMIGCMVASTEPETGNKKEYKEGRPGDEAAGCSSHEPMPEPACKEVA